MTRCRILIVEDELVLAHSTRTVLESLGYAVVGIVRSGQEAIRQAGELRPDLVLMDIKLAGDLGGIEAAEQIRTRSGIPVIYVTGYSDEDTLRRARSAEPFGYLRKPFRPEELRGVIEMALYKHEMEKRLMDSERCYWLLAENAGDMISRHTPDGAYLYASPACRTLLGYGPDELAGRNVQELLHPEDRDTVMASHRAIAEQQATHTVQHRMRRKDGSYVWVETASKAVHDPDTGQVQETIAITRDITECKRAEEALRSSQWELERTLEATADGIWAWNFARDQLTFSPRYYEMLGYAPDAFPATYESWVNLIHPDDRRPALAVANEYLRTKPDDYENEFRLRARDGSYRWIHARARVVERDEQGRAVYMIGNHQDITERKQVEEALRRSLERSDHRQRLLLALSEAAPAVQRARTPQQVFEAIGDEIGKLGYTVTVFSLAEERSRLAVAYVGIPPEVVRAAEKLTGLSASRYSFPFAPGSFYERLIREGRAVFSDPGAGPIADALPKRARPLAGRLAALLSLGQAICVPLSVDGQVHSILAVIGGGLAEDDVPAVTAFANQAATALENVLLLEQLERHRDDLRRLSAQLVRAQEEERGRISRELHDEMGQALTAMSINLTEVEKALAAVLSPEAKARLAETTLLADQTLEQVRELSLSLRPSLLDDLGLSPALRWYLGQAASRLNIEVAFEALGLEARLPGEVETALYRVVQEALTNVAKHADARKVSVRIARADGEVLATVEDDGCGFAARQPDLAAPPPGAGLLGMRERVTALGGRLDVCSRPGQGTRLSIRIPLREEAT